MILIGQTQIWRLKSGTDKPTELELLDHHLNNFIFVFDQVLISEDKLKIKLDYNFQVRLHLLLFQFLEKILKVIICVKTNEVSSC